MSLLSHFRAKNQHASQKQTANDADRALIARCRDGDRAAQFQLYEKYKNLVYNIAFRMANDSQVAEDLVQEIFIKVFKNLARFRGDAAFSSWLYRITSNVCINHFRTANRWKKLLSNGLHDADNRADGENPQRPSEMTPHLERAIRQLPEGYRMVFVLHDVQGFRHQEIGDMLDIAVGTSKSQLHKARKELRKSLTPVLEMHRALAG